MTLPDWGEIDDKIFRHERLTALEEFIYDYEPNGVEETEAWREALVKILKEQTLRE